MVSKEINWKFSGCSREETTEHPELKEEMVVCTYRKGLNYRETALEIFVRFCKHY